MYHSYSARQCEVLRRFSKTDQFHLGTQRGRSLSVVHSANACLLCWSAASHRLKHHVHRRSRTLHFTHTEWTTVYTSVRGNSSSCHFWYHKSQLEPDHSLESRESVVEETGWQHEAMIGFRLTSQLLAFETVQLCS